MEIGIGFFLFSLVAAVCWAVLYVNKTGSRANLWLQLAIWAKTNHEAELFRQRRKKELAAEWAL